MDRPKLNFPSVNLRYSEDSKSVWDDLRRIYVVLTPEEWVRRHVVGYLRDFFGVPPAQILVEYAVKLNGQTQRADVVVIGSDLEPKLLVECKAADVKLSQSTLDQVVRYNSVLSAKYVMLTNGLSHHVYERADESGGYVALKSLPSLQDLI